MRQVSGGEVNVQEPLPNLLVVGMQLRGIVQDLDGLGLPPFFGERRRDVFQIAQGAGLVAHFDPRARRRPTPFVVLGIERSEADLRLEHATHVPFGAPQLDERVQVSPRVGVQPLAPQDLGDLQEPVLVIGLELENLLVDRAGFCNRAFVVEIPGNLHELLDGFVDLPGAGVEIREGILAVPVSRLIFDEAHEFRDGGVIIGLGHFDGSPLG